MAVRFVLTEYVSQLMAHAVYDKLEYSTFAGRIPPCKGVIAFETTLCECEDELLSCRPCNVVRYIIYVRHN